MNVSHRWRIWPCRRSQNETLLVDGRLLCHGISVRIRMVFVSLGRIWSTCHGTTSMLILVMSWVACTCVVIGVVSSCRSRERSSMNQMLYQTRWHRRLVRVLFCLHYSVWIVFGFYSFVLASAWVVFSLLLCHWRSLCHSHFHSFLTCVCGISYSLGRCCLVNTPHIVVLVNYRTLSWNTHFGWVVRWSLDSTCTPKLFVV